MEWCERVANEQLQLTDKLVCIQISDGLLNLFASNAIEAKENQVSSFFWLREVRIVNKKFATCSCSLLVRMKFPCRHIMKVIGKTGPKMYWLRWHLNYQIFLKEKGMK